jgi:hypothetical protein
MEEYDTFIPIYTNDESDKIKVFYKLKEAYEETLRKKKYKLIKNTHYSVKERRNKWKKEKHNCIHCKNPGGTYFSDKNRHLIAQCKASPPCKLNIDINLPVVGSIYSTIINQTEENQDINDTLIQSKLDLLFGYTTDEESITSTLEELTEGKELVDEYTTMYNDIYKNLQVLNKIHTLSDSIENYIADIQSSSIVDAIALQTTKLQDAIAFKRLLSYDYYTVEHYNGRERMLIREITSILRTEATNDEMVINKFIL